MTMVFVINRRPSTLLQRYVNMEYKTSHISSLGLFEDDVDSSKETETTSENTELTIGTSSSAISILQDKINKICLTFTHTESPSKREKCKMFWKYVDSRPDLEGMKVLGWNEKQLTIKRWATYHSEEYLKLVGKVDQTEPYKKRDLDILEEQLTTFGEFLGGCRKCIEKKQICSHIQHKGVFADMIKERPEEIMAHLTDLDDSPKNKGKVQKYSRKSLPGYVPRTLKMRAITQTGEDKAVPYPH